MPKKFAPGRHDKKSKVSTHSTNKPSSKAEPTPPTALWGPRPPHHGQHTESYNPLQLERNRITYIIHITEI